MYVGPSISISDIYIFNLFPVYGTPEMKYNQQKNTCQNHLNIGLRE
jgi:hypothetical protein